MNNVAPDSPATSPAAATSPPGPVPLAAAKPPKKIEKVFEDVVWPPWLTDGVAPTMLAGLKTVADVRMKRIAAAAEVEEYIPYAHMGGWWEWQIFVRKNIGNMEHDYMPTFGLGQESIGNVTDNLEDEGSIDKSKKKAATDEELGELTMKEGKSEFSKAVALVSSKRNVQSAAGYSNLASFTNSHPKEMIKLFSSGEFKNSLARSDAEMLRIAGFGFKEMLKPVAGSTIKSSPLSTEDIDGIVYPLVLKIIAAEEVMENETTLNTW